MTTTEVRQHPALPLLLGLGVLVIGLVLGWFASALTGSLAGLIEATPLPVPKPIQLVESMPLAWTLGILGGLRARLDADTLSWAKVQAALEQHRWTWRDADPYEERFERWLDGRPGFTAAENEALRRRLEDRKDAAGLRKADDDLAALGLVARVRDDRIQVRRVASADEGVRGTDR